VNAQLRHKRPPSGTSASRNGRMKLGRSTAVTHHSNHRIAYSQECDKTRNILSRHITQPSN